jgi:class 3 adenylate cyclase
LTGSTSATTAGGSAYRGFLFSDLRGYTSFIERAGNAAGVELLDDYLAIVRSAVAQHQGAEIKVEGDGFHAVFPSASSAVMCGLAIVGAADEANKGRPDRPILVGVGIHAGEAVETPDGFIGAAVNLAARVCAAASPGEVLVTGTVRGITQASIPVTFVARGRPRLKGFTDPVDVYAAVPAGTAPARVGRRRGIPWPVAGLAVLAALAALAVIVAVALPGLGGGTPTPSPSATARSLAVGPLELGEYVADAFHPSFSFTIDDPGWSVYRVYPDALGLLYAGAPEGRMDIGRIPLLYTDPCIPDGPSVATGTSVNDLVSALQSVRFLEVGEVEAAEISRTYAITVDATVDTGAQAACGGFGGDGVALFRVTNDVWSAMPGEMFRLSAVDVEATTVSFVISAEASPAASVSEIVQLFARAERILSSVQF